MHLFYFNKLPETVEIILIYSPLKKPIKSKVYLTFVLIDIIFYQNSYYLFLAFEVLQMCEYFFNYTSEDQQINLKKR